MTIDELTASIEAALERDEPVFRWTFESGQSINAPTEAEARAFLAIPDGVTCRRERVYFMWEC